MYAPTILATSEPPIPTARRWAARYDGAAGLPLDLTQAVPGYPPHPGLLQRLGEAAARAEMAGYGPIEGDMPLREALADDVSRVYAAKVSAGDVAITAGCNLAFHMAVTVLAAPGDNVLVPTPWYFNHEMALRMSGVETRPLPCEPGAGFVPDVDRAEALMDGRSRAILLVTPNNPTGATYPPETIAAFQELCERRGVTLLLDETYRDFLDARPHALLAERRSFVHLYSFSKAYCIPGHRLGAVIAPPAFQEQLRKALDTFQICPARPAQAALAWAIPALQDWRAGNRRVMADRAQACRKALAGHRIDALGAYFAYLRLPDEAPEAEAAAQHLAERKGLLVLPGTFFGPGQERYLRLAFANVEAERLRDLPERLAW